jgi:carbon monoxide dehydrogenase subunit G
MKMDDTQSVPAPRAKVWAALNDPEILKKCIPGCERLEMTSPTEMLGAVVVKVGPVKANFTGKVTLSDLDPPKGYRISGEGTGGVAGFAKGGATVTLTPEGPSATLLHYVVDAQIGGKLAQLGARLIDSTAKKLAGEFFRAFAEAVAGAEAPLAALEPHAPVAPLVAPTPPVPTPVVPARKPEGWLRRLIAVLRRLLGLERTRQSS